MSKRRNVEYEETTNKHTVKKKTHWSNEIENCNGNNNDEEDELEWTSDSILANDPWIDNNEEEEDSLEWTFGRLKFNISKDHSEEPVYLPEHLNNFIKPYQYKGVQFICDNIINNNFGIILAHSMGLGKTMQIIVSVDIFFRTTKFKKVLIVCPKIVARNWWNEFEKWMPEKEKKENGVVFPNRNFDVFLFDDNSEKTRRLSKNELRQQQINAWNEKGGVLIMGYEMFRQFYEHNESYDALIDPGPDLVVCDEGHRIKNENKKIYQALKSLKTKRRIVITGYPLQNNLMELFNMINFVRFRALGAKKTFKLQFETPIKRSQRKDSTENERKDAEQLIYHLVTITKPFIHRRSERILNKILPEKKERIIFVHKSLIQRELYKAFDHFMKKDMESAKENTKSNKNYLKELKLCHKILDHPDFLYEDMEKNVSQNKPLDEVTLSSNFAESNHKSFAEHDEDQNDDKNYIEYFMKYQWTGYAKEMLVNSYKMLLSLALIDETVRNGDKILLFCQHTRTIDKIESFLKTRRFTTKDDNVSFWKKDRNYFRIDGKTSNREYFIDKFQTDPNVFLFLISTQAGSVGINLTAANRAILFDVSLNPCDDAQAVCRVYRLGQEKPTFIYRLVGYNSMEIGILKRNLNKQILFQKVIEKENMDANNAIQILDNLSHYQEENDNHNGHIEKISRDDDKVLAEVMKKNLEWFAMIPWLESSLITKTDELLSVEDKQDFSERMQQAGDAISLEMIKEHFSRIKEYFTSDKEKEFWASVKYIFDNFKNNTPEMLEQIRKRLKKKLDDMETEKLIVKQQHDILNNLNVQQKHLKQEIAKTLQQERELSERLSSAHIDLQKFDEWFSKRGARLTGLREELIKCDEEIEKYNLKLKNYLPQNVAQTSTQTNQLLDELAIDGCEDEEFQMLIRKRVQDFLKETKSLKDQKIAEIKSSLEEAKRRANDVNEKHDLLLNEQTSKREEKTQMELKIENLKEKIADACAERERYDDELKKNEKEITKSQTICQNYESQQLELEITRLLKDIELLEKELTRQNTAEQDEELSQTGSAVTVRDGDQPYNMIAPFFQELANKHPQLTYAKVGGKKLKKTALRRNVNAYPTLFASLNGQKTGPIRGADKAQLVKKRVQNCPSPGDSRVPGQTSLNSFINGHQVECLNEDDRNTLHMLLSNAGSLISDCDEQLIINLPFKQQVKVHSVYLKGPAEHAPRIVKVFANIPNTLDFDKAQSTEPIQTLDFSESEILPLRFVKFQNVTNLQLFVESNKGDNDKTVIKELRIYGMPLTTTNMEEFKRVA